MNDKKNSQEKKHNTNRIIYKDDFQQIQERDIMYAAIPQLSQLCILRYERATLLDSSTTIFGDECLRLVNIAFETSKVFPSIMGTCDTVTEYLQKQLQQRYPKKHFHIIIAENDGFSFAINNYSHFADIKQEQYRILIFSTEPYEKLTIDTYEANSQMKLQWKSVVFKKIIH